MHLYLLYIRSEIWRQSLIKRGFIQIFRLENECLCSHSSDIHFNFELCLLSWLYWGRDLSRIRNSSDTRKFEMRTSCMQEQLPNPLSHEIQRKALHFFLTTLELTHFNPVSHFYTPRKRQKTKGFSNVFRGYRNMTLD